MKLIASLRSVASNVSKSFGRSLTPGEVEDELRSHIAHRADDLERSGITRREAERRARVEFGGFERFRQESRQALGGNFWETLMQDVRFGLRMLRKKPGFTFVAVLTLAFAVGSNAVAFSVLNGLVLKPNQLPEPRNLWMIEEGKHHFEQSYPDYLDMQRRTQAFEGLVAFDYAPVGLDAGVGASAASGNETSANYFDVLGVQPYLGRFFHASDDHGAGSAPFLVLSYAYWQTHFQGDRGVIGRTVLVNKYPFTILGVARPEFRGTAVFILPEFWAPMVNQAQLLGESHLTERTNHSLWIVGKAKRGLSLAQLNQDMDVVARSLIKDYPKEDDGISFNLARPELMGDYAGEAARAFLGGLMALAGLILLAACANLGSLFAARAADRAKEIAVRLALGSSRKRIVRQLVTEAVMIAFAGGVVGVALSVPLLRKLSFWEPIPGFPISMPVIPDGRVYFFALVLALVSGVLFGLVPVRQVMAASPYEVIKSGASSLGRRVTLRDALLAFQIALCAVMVTASLVAVRGLMRTMHTDPGFDTKNTIVVGTDLAMARYNGDQRAVMQERMLDAVEKMPGVTAAGYADSVPLDMNTNFTRAYADSTTDLKASNAVVQMVPYAVSSGYFRAAGTPLLTGRAFTVHDDLSAPRVAIVNAEFARKVFGSVEKAMGGHFKKGDGTRLEVVGVAPDGKYTSFTEDPQPVVFSSILQSPASATTLVVRSNEDFEHMAKALRATLHDLDAGLPVSVDTWTGMMDIKFFPARVATASLGVLGGLGAMLSVTGIFGMAAYSVSKRLREFGIRIALGAQRAEVLRAALGRTFRLLALGSAAGVLLGVLSGKGLGYIVSQATPWDPVVLGGVLGTMVVLGLLAGWVPARRALAIDPLILLRED